MKPNLNSIDRVIRVLLAVTFGVLYYMGIITGVLGIALLVFGVILVFTSFLKFCPIYRIFGISTCKTKSA